VYLPSPLPSLPGASRAKSGSEAAGRHASNACVARNTQSGGLRRAAPRIVPRKPGLMTQTSRPHNLRSFEILRRRGRRALSLSRSGKFPRPEHPRRGHRQPWTARGGHPRRRGQQPDISLHTPPWTFCRTSARCRATPWKRIASTRTCRTTLSSMRPSSASARASSSSRASFSAGMTSGCSPSLAFGHVASVSHLHRTARPRTGQFLIPRYPCRCRPRRC